MGSSPTRGSSFFLGKVTALGVLCLPCLFDLACFFLPSFSSLIKNMYFVLYTLHFSVHEHVRSTPYIFLCMNMSERMWSYKKRVRQTFKRKSLAPRYGCLNALHIQTIEESVDKLYKRRCRCHLRTLLS